MDEAAKLELKKKIIEEQMAKFWEFCNKCQSDSQERESWVSGNGNGDYNNDTRVVADSIQEYSQIFLNGLTQMIEKI